MTTLAGLLEPSVLASLQTKQTGLAEALAQSAQMNARLTALASERAQADEARRQAEEQRQRAASDIVRTALNIVGLDEEFERTQILGYLTRCKEEQARLSALIHRYRSQAVWTQVQEQYKRIEQGLTIGRILHMNALLEPARP